MIERILIRMSMVLIALTAMVAITALAFSLSNGQQATAQSDQHFEKGDVFAAVGDPDVSWFREDGTFVGTLDTEKSGYNAGMAFDAAGNLYVTNYDARTVSKFDISGTPLGTFGSGYSSRPESIVFDRTGNAYVGTVHGPDNNIRKFNAEGTPVAQFTVTLESNGSDWIDLAADQCTMFYTSEGQRIMRYDVCTPTQLADFASGLPGHQAFALRILPDGGVLVADTQAIYRLDAVGTIVMTYTVPGETRWRNLSLAPDGISFWGGGYDGYFYRFDITTGQVLTGPIDPDPTPGRGTFRGMAVFCEPTAASYGCADLAVIKADSSDPVTVGNHLTYSIKVANSGPADATGVIVTDVLPPGVSLVSATSSQGCAGTSTITCTLGNVASGGSVTIEIVVTPTEAGTITNTVTVTANETDPDPSNNTDTEGTTVESPPPTPTATATPKKKPKANPNEIPEPLTLLLMGGGLAALAGYARRRRLTVGRHGRGGVPPQS